MAHRRICSAGFLIGNFSLLRGRFSQAGDVQSGWLPTSSSSNPCGMACGSLLLRPPAEGINADYSLRWHLLENSVPWDHAWPKRRGENEP